MGIFYLSIKFELDRSINKGDLLSDRDHWTLRKTDTDRQTHNLNLILSPFRIKGRVIKTCQCEIFFNFIFIMLF